MAEGHREVAGRLKGLTLTTAGIVGFASAIEGGLSSQEEIRAAAEVLSDSERTRVVAFLIEFRHERRDAGDADTVCVADALIDALAQHRWDELADLED